MRYLGFGVLSYTSDLEDDKRAELIAKFNNADAKVKVLLLSLSVNIADINFEPVCHYGICSMFYNELLQMKQALGCLRHFQQKSLVEWYIIKQTGSYSDIQEQTMHAKQATLYKAASIIPRWLGNDIRRICFFEIARDDWGTMESKYVYEKYHLVLDKVSKWSDNWTRRFAKYYSMVASLAFQSLNDYMTDDDRHDLIDKLGRLSQDMRAIVLV